MKFEKIVGFGDSWMWGDELLDPDLVNLPDAHPALDANVSYREKNCFLGKLGQHYGVPVQNFGIAGGSMQSTIWTYLWWMDHETIPLDRCLVLVALTDANRQSFYNPNQTRYSNDPPWWKFQHSSWAHNPGMEPEWKDLIKHHMALTNCEQSRNLNYRQTVMFFDGRARSHCALLQFNTIYPYVPMTESSLLWPDIGLRLMFQKSPHRQSLLAQNGHPNVSGHDWITQLLIIS